MILQNIFLSIDFSDHAYHAALYAASLASHTGARLILFHAYDPVMLSEEEELEEELQDTERHVQDKLDAWALELKALHDISITRLLKPGNVVSETLSISQKIKADLIILGIAGTTDKHLPLLDEQTREILSNSKLPVLLVPPHTTFTSGEPVFLAAEEEIEFGLINYKLLDKLFYCYSRAQQVLVENLKVTPGEPQPLKDEVPGEQNLLPAEKPV